MWFRVEFRVLAPWSRAPPRRRLGAMKTRAPQALAAVAAAGAVAAAVVPAFAQDQPATRIEAHAVASPSRAGTPAHPRGLAISATARLTTAPDLEPPIVTGIDILVGRGLIWNRRGYATCAKATLDRRGPAGCPRASIMGTATATGRADTVPATLRVTFANGGPDITYAYAALDNPARVRETLTLRTARPAAGPWGERESVAIPRSLQLVAGVPLNLNNIRFTVGGKSYAKDYIVSTRCPKGGWRYQVTAHYLYDSSGATTGDQTNGVIACS
jgi:hypothetical protein